MRAALSAAVGQVRPCRARCCRGGFDPDSGPTGRRPAQRPRSKAPTIALMLHASSYPSSGHNQRRQDGATLADLKAERAALGAKGRQIETESAPIRYVAELVGADTHLEKAIRWLIALMVLTCDPLAISLTAAASARR